MKNIVRLGALLSLGLFAVACIGPTSDPGEGDEAVGEAQDMLPTYPVLTTYFKEAAHITVVGSCVGPSICTGSTTTCSGTKTAYYEKDTGSCY